MPSCFFLEHKQYPCIPASSRVISFLATSISRPIGVSSSCHIPRSHSFAGTMHKHNHVANRSLSIVYLFIHTNNTTIHLSIAQPSHLSILFKPHSIRSRNFALYNLTSQNGVHVELAAKNAKGGAGRTMRCCRICGVSDRCTN